LSEPGLNKELVEKKVFVVVLVFSVIAGLNGAFTPFMHYYFTNRFGLSMAEYGAFTMLQWGLQYLFSPVMFFVVLYLSCGGPLLHRIASVLTSLVLGSLIGYWIGGSIGVIIVTAQLGDLASNPSFYPIYSLTSNAVGQVLMGFAVLAFSDFDAKWRNALAGLQSKRPAGLVLLALLYVIFALLNTLTIPLVAFILPYVNTTSNVTFAIATQAIFFGLIVAGQLLLAGGLYYGRKWAWIIALVSSASSLLIDALALGVLFTIPEPAETLPLIVGLLISCLLSLFITLYLLSFEVRQFFGFINPIATKETQDKT